MDRGSRQKPKNRGPPRRMDRTRERECQRQIEEMVASGILEVSRAGYYSHALMVPKANGKLRFCVDFKMLNLVTEREGWPIPNIELMLKRIGDRRPKYFIVIDLTSGYFQIPVAEESRKFTAFITESGLFQWRRLPMGLKGAPSFFQRVMVTIVLAGLVMVICELYLDDLILYAQTCNELLQNFRTVLIRFREFNIYINPEKCKMGLTEVTYVGHTINEEGIHFSREKLDGILNFVKPSTQKGLKSFAGLANYFRDHVRNHSVIMVPLNNMLKAYERNKRLEWTTEAEEAFEEIKRSINECPRLFFLEEESEVHLYTDASDFGIGAHLTQMIHGQENPIGFISKAFDSRMMNWDVPQKEGYAIYYALTKVGIPIERQRI